MKRPLCLLFILPLLILLPRLLWGTVVTFVQTSASTWDVRYDGFANVGGVVFSVKFDPDSATAGGARKGGSVPSASQYVVGVPSSGEIRVAIAGLTALPKSGTLATVTLTPKGGEPRLLEVSAQLSSVDAKRLPNAAVQVVRSSFSQPDQSAGSGGGGAGTGTGTGTGTGSSAGTGNGTGTSGGSPSGQGGWSVTPPGGASTGTPIDGVSGGVGGEWRSTSYINAQKTQSATQAAGVVVGSVSIVDGTVTPSEKGAKEAREKGEKIQAVRRSVGEDRPADAEEGRKKEPEKKKEPRSITYAGVIDRFREFSGVPSKEEYLGLFVDPVSPDITQTPFIAWLDEKEQVTIRMKDSLLVTSEPSFILKGAALIDLRKGEGEWVLSITPRIKGGDRRLVILDGGERTIDYPLLIVPKITLPLTAKKEIDPNGFSLLMADATKKTSTFDFDRDGRHTSVDDYIFTANYIAQTKTTPVKPKGGAGSGPEKKGGGAPDQTKKSGELQASPKDGEKKGASPTTSPVPPRFDSISSPRTSAGAKPADQPGRKKKKGR
ncbi:MAG: hypothetical protein Fur0034_16520 [Desulfuromonadia bacterium]